MKTRKVFLITLLVALGTMFLVQACAPPGPSDVFGLVGYRCDNNPNEITYTAGGVGTTVIIRVLNICSLASIEYQDANGRWVEPQVDRDGTIRPVVPQAGSAYAVTITRNRKLRLTCRRGENEADSCHFELVNATVQPTSAQKIIDTVSVDCGDWQSAKFFNFSAIPIRVRIFWANVCKDSGPHNTRVPHAPDAGLKTTGMLSQDFRVAGHGALTDSTAEWRGNVDSRTELGIRCPGTFPGCKFVVSYIRN